MQLKKNFVSLLLAAVFVMASALPALALKVDDHPADEYKYEDTIMPVRGDKGLLEAITYNVTNTGATSGIRYRTKEITFQVGDFAGWIDAADLRKARPQPGQRTVSVITITVGDIAEAVKQPDSDEFRQLVSQPGMLNIGAVIEIYNAATGEVLDTISSPDQVIPVTSKYGFDRGSVEDMLNRYKGDVVKKEWNTPSPDLYAAIDPHSVEANPGQELTFNVTFGNAEIPGAIAREGVVKALHEVSGNEYPVEIKLDGKVVGPEEPIEFDVGQERKGTVTVHAQNVGSKVIVKIYPVLAMPGNIFYLKDDADWSNNRGEAEIKVKAPELVVTPPSATVDVGGTQQYRATYYPKGKDNGNGQDVTAQCSWTVQDHSIASIGGNTGLATGTNPGTTQVTATYNAPGVTLQGQAGLTVRGKQPPPPVNVTTGDGLHFQAVSQYNALTGKPDDPPREPDTAKWTDTVTATLKPLKVQNVVTEDQSPPDYSTTVAPPPPPSGGCDPNFTEIESWRLVRAKLTYPKQNPHYTFGHPLPPEGTETADMAPTEDGHALTCQFKEMWAENGTYLHDILDPSMDEWIQTPQTYTLTASDIAVEVRYTLVTHHLHCTKDGCDCVADVERGLVYTYTLSPINGNLLVNGTGVASVGM
ncbi:hypothetical protein GFC01_06170 [Desulfofundulus thermobenzoicus]|uniref:BIG2 domain-containing protein n=1 Tax=Desulfofundulus thermobenzoicus TaxID=29376 RepID=A0A6N7IPA3_9FIRM|nr:Ig-like domain-containing protein [Desulfofundulus thermobenzoicus]MQL51856.1 hypothetical protein [Desulfofundulus thermobenzoicus]